MSDLCDWYEGRREAETGNEKRARMLESTAGQLDDFKTADKNLTSLKDLEVKSKKHRTFIAVMWRILQNSSVYAISKLGSSSSWHRKILWALVLSIGIVGCSYEISRFLKLYFQYPVVISLQVENEWKLTFPAVSVCNLNRLQKSSLNHSEYCTLFPFDEEVCSHVLINSGIKHAPTAPERMMFATCSGHKSGRYNNFDLAMQTFLNAYNSLTEEKQSKLGHQVENFVKYCRFNGEPCSERNFTAFWSSQYGNCFTFNGKLPEGAANLVTQYVGPNSGLELELDLEVSDYTLLSREFGARVVIHYPTSSPNPESRGIDIKPGEQTSVSIRQTSIRRLPHPYKDRCRVYEAGSEDLPGNQHDCIRQCLQEVSLLKCKCIDPSIAAVANATFCSLSNRMQVCCLDEVLKNVSNNGLPCDCPLPCVDIDYEMTLSSSVWPTDKYFTKFRYVPVRENLNVSDVHSVISRIADFRKNRAKLKVFYQTLEHKYYNQEPMYQDSELFSHLGGQMGLWLGLSIVAAFECIEGFVLIFQFLVKKKHGSYLK